MGIIRYGRTAQIGVYPGNQSGNTISYRSGGVKFPLDPDTQVAWQFAQEKSLTDLVQGLTLDFTRTSLGTFVGADKLIKTAPSNVARFDHDPVTGESLGLLIEEERTNICKDTEDLTSANWVTSDVDIVPNDAAAPDGALTADLVRPDANPSGNHYVQTVALNTSSGIDYTVSIFVKAAGYDFFVLKDAIVSGFVEFNLATGQIESISGGYTGAIQDFGNGWYRCSVTFSQTSTGGGRLRAFVFNAAGLPSFPGDGTSGIYMWGGQYEAGTFKTSYIPNNTVLDVEVTRARDNCSTTDVSWYSPSAPGTVYTNIVRIYTVDQPNVRPYDLNAQVYSVAVASLKYWRHTAGGLLIDSSGILSTVGVPDKIGFAFDTNDAAVYINGVFGGADAVGALPVAASSLQLGSRANLTGQLNGHIREFGYANVRKDDQFLQRITEP